MDKLRRQYALHQKYRKKSSSSSKSSSTNQPQKSKTVSKRTSGNSSSNESKLDGGASYSHNNSHSTSAHEFGSASLATASTAAASFDSNEHKSNTSHPHRQQQDQHLHHHSAPLRTITNQAPTHTSTTAANRTDDVAKGMSKLGLHLHKDNASTNPDTPDTTTAAADEPFKQRTSSSRRRRPASDHGLNPSSNGGGSIGSDQVMRNSHSMKRAHSFGQQGQFNSQQQQHQQMTNHHYNNSRSKPERVSRNSSQSSKSSGGGGRQTPPPPVLITTPKHQSRNMVDNTKPARMHEKYPQDRIHNANTNASKAKAIPTTSTTANNNNNNNKSEKTESYATTHMVPTEAQLRWAQFHRKNRIQNTQTSVMKLMSFPLNLSDVEEAHSSDGRSYTSYESLVCSDSSSTEDNGNVNGHGTHNLPLRLNRQQSSSSSSKKKRRMLRKKKKNNNIPSLSKGRRALLRVSARKTKERQLFIQKHGFEMSPDDSEEEIISSKPLHHHNHHHAPIELDSITHALDMTVCEDDLISTNPSLNPSINPSLNPSLSHASPHGRMNGAITTTPPPSGIIIGRTISSKKKKKKNNSSTVKRLRTRRSVANTAFEEEERVRRFEEAYIAICNIAAASQKLKEDEEATKKNNGMESMSSGKRWTRGSHVQVAISIDGREYHDLQRSPAFKDNSLDISKRYGAEMMGAQFTNGPLEHLPGGEEGPHTPSGCGRIDPNTIISPGKQKLMELVSRLQESPQIEGEMMESNYIKECNVKTHHTVTTTHAPKTKLKKDLNVETKSAKDLVKEKVLTPLMAGVNVKGLRDRLMNNSDASSFSISQQSEDGQQQYDEKDNIRSRGKKAFGLASRYIKSLQPSKPQHEIQEKINGLVQQQATNIGTNVVSNDVIDTDGNSIITEGMDPDRVTELMSSLMLSPAILSKRLNQAIQAVESHNWEQVDYILNANPWLAEMPDVTSNQYLLHKLASHGSIGQLPASEDLNQEIIMAFPPSVHKFDNNGNLPLHMAAAAGNTSMIMQLGERFSSGASVRNNDGFLPLHLAILACADPFFLSEQQQDSPVMIVKSLMDMFPGALVVGDNDGNLPLHLAATFLAGDIGMDVIYLLVDEAMKQGQALRLPKNIKPLENNKADDDSVTTDSITIPPTDIGIDDATTLVQSNGSCILFAKNSLGWTPLICAVKNKSGWQVIEAILTCLEVDVIRDDADEHGQNILQLTIGEECCDPLSVLSILKVMPELATVPSEDGILPIEVACMQGLKSEVIMAIALVDLPIDLDAKDNLKIRDGYGESWWYLTCDCDDAHVDIVKEILAICTYPQKRDLCFLKGKHGSVIKRASPKCKLTLRKALRFAGRYEFTGGSVIKSESSEESKVFEALDFGTDDDPIEDGRRVHLKYYAQAESCANDTHVLQSIDLNHSNVARIHVFCANAFESHVPDQYCIASERRELTLTHIVSKMESYKRRSDQDRLSQFINKIRKVLFMIAKGIHHLHLQGVVHGNINLDTCGKFEKDWKVMDLTGIQFVGEILPLSRYYTCAPPEAITIAKNTGRAPEAEFVDTIIASHSLDIWAFGKLMYEVLVGKPLHLNEIDDEKTLLELGYWDGENLEKIVAEVEDSGVGTIGADLITHCLCPFPEDRPSSMDEVLSHPYWKKK